MKIKTKTYTKKNKKSGLNSISTSSSPFAFEIAGIYRRNTEGRGVQR